MTRGIYTFHSISITIRIIDQRQEFFLFYKFIDITDRLVSLRSLLKFYNFHYFSFSCIVQLLKKKKKFKVPLLCKLTVISKLSLPYTSYKIRFPCRTPFYIYGLYTNPQSVPLSNSEFFPSSSHPTLWSFSGPTGSSTHQILRSDSLHMNDPLPFCDPRQNPSFYYNTLTKKF